MGRPDAAARAVEREVGIEAEARALNACYGGLDARAAIVAAVNDLYPGRVALVSSFGAESAVLLHLLSEVDRSVPVIFLDTGRLFAETLAYRTRLVARLGLADVRSVTPDPDQVRAGDPHRALWMADPDLCCRIRKTEPLVRALDGFDAWFTGRKRFQSATRAELGLFEADGGRIKINPLANWSADDLKGHMQRHDLPSHPLVRRGYPSIGCEPCTSRVAPGEDARAGRWRGTEKTECGIHVGLEADGSGI